MNYVISFATQKMGKKASEMLQLFCDIPLNRYHRRSRLKMSWLVPYDKTVYLIIITTVEIVKGIFFLPLSLDRA